jgi:hypothetical protein
VEKVSVLTVQLFKLQIFVQLGISVIPLIGVRDLNVDMDVQVTINVLKYNREQGKGLTASLALANTSVKLQ